MTSNSTSTSDAMAASATASRSVVPGRPSRHRVRIALVAIAVTLAVAGGGSALVLPSLLDPGPAVAGATEVTLRGSEFLPAAIAVPAGTTVTWRWADVEEHNVVGEGFESPIQVHGEYMRTFADPRTYAYQCTLHFLMRGEVVVE